LGLVYNRRSASLNALSVSGSGYSTCLWTSIGRNVSQSRHVMRESTQVSTAHWWYYCPDTLLRSSISANTNQQHASGHQCTIQTPEAPHQGNLSASAFSVGCSSAVHSRSMRFAFSIGIRTSGVLLASLNSEHLLMVQGFAICIILCTGS